MNRQLAYFDFETLPCCRGLACRGVKRNDHVAKQAWRSWYRNWLILCKGKHISRLILLPVAGIQVLHGGIIHQCYTYFDFTGLDAFRTECFINCRA